MKKKSCCSRVESSQPQPLLQPCHRHYYFCCSPAAGTRAFCSLLMCGIFFIIIIIIISSGIVSATCLHSVLASSHTLVILLALKTAISRGGSGSLYHPIYVFLFIELVMDPALRIALTATSLLRLVEAQPDHVAPVNPTRL